MNKSTMEIIQGRFYRFPNENSVDIIYCIKKLNLSVIEDAFFKSKAILILKEGIACHGATLRIIMKKFNILPKYVFPNVSADFLKLEEGCNLTLVPNLNIAKSNEYRFSLFSKINTEKSELFGWNILDESLRCERPNRKYLKITHNSIILGLKEFSKIIEYESQFMLFFDDYNRLWQRNFPCVKDITDWIILNPDNFLIISKEYLDFLNNILLSHESITSKDYLNHVLPTQFKFIRFFSSTPSEFRKLINTYESLDYKCIETYKPLLKRDYFQNTNKYLLNFSYNISAYLISIENSINWEKKNKLIYYMTICTLISDYKKYLFSYLRNQNHIYNYFKPTIWQNNNDYDKN